MDLSAEGGGEAGAHRLESNTQQKGKKCSEKCLNIFVMQKCSDGDKHFSEQFIFHHEMKLQIPKRLSGGTKCIYEILASQNQKKESGKDRLNYFSGVSNYVL